MDALFYPGSPSMPYVTLGKIDGQRAISADAYEADDYNSYIDAGYTTHSLEPLSLGTALGFGLITILILITYGVFKAFSLVRIKNQ